LNIMVFSGAEIKRARKAKGKTLEALAKEIGTSKFALSRWENDKARPSEDAAHKLAAWLAAEAAQANTRQPNSPVAFQHNELNSFTFRTVSQALEIKVSGKLRRDAEELDLDLAYLFETIGTTAVRKALEDEWKRQSAEAIRHNNREFERNGLPLAAFRNL
jgi:transcriptional regulator with XRE-family HTH domain